jgi:hypothetical protein
MVVTRANYMLGTVQISVHISSSYPHYYPHFTDVETEVLRIKEHWAKIP